MFQHIHVGDTSATVLQKLGQPDKFGPSKNDPKTIEWHYEKNNEWNGEREICLISLKSDRVLSSACTIAPTAGQLILSSMGSSSSSQGAGSKFYKVIVTRLNADLYKDSQSGVIIKTRYCYEYAYSDQSLLEYEKYSLGNRIVFSNGQTCEVVDVGK